MSLIPKLSDLPKFQYETLTYMVYGPPGIGKTTFCANLPDVLILDTEKGSGLQKVHRTQIKDWDTFLRVVDELLKGSHGYKNIVVDTVGWLVNYSFRYSCQKLNIEHPSEAAYGKGWDVAKRTFNAPIAALQHSSYTLWFIAHSTIKKITSRGMEYDYKQPDLPGYLHEFVISLCDFILLMDVEAKQIRDESGRLVGVIDERIIRTKPGKNWLAKDRFPKKKLPETITLPSDNPTKDFFRLFNECVEKE